MLLCLLSSLSCPEEWREAVRREVTKSSPLRCAVYVQTVEL